jgi:hypothetical protein
MRAHYRACIDDSLEEELLKAVRRAPNRRPEELAQLVGFPRTNFGRPLSRRVRRPLDRLCSEGLVEAHDGRYRLAERGRRLLAERAAGADEPG